MATQERCRAGRRPANEAAMLRRVVKQWITTGTVPVAHIVADLVELEDAPAALPTIVLSLPNPAQAALA
jgi:hypothetical protein